MFAILVVWLGEQFVSWLLPCLPDNSSLLLSGPALCQGQAGDGSPAPAACASGAPSSSAQLAFSQQRYPSLPPEKHRRGLLRDGLMKH